MILEVKSSKTRFSLEFYGKFNFLTGMSGSHKSHLVNSLRRAKSGVSSVGCKCINDDDNRVSLNKIILFDNNTVIAGNYHDLFAQYKGGLIIIDECSEILKQYDIASVLRDTDNQVLIISRTPFNWLPISVESIYYLKNDKGVIKNYAVYCNHNEDLVIKKPFKYVLTEDSGSGREFFLAHFADRDVCSKHVLLGGKKVTRDNSHLHKTLEEDLKAGKTDILVVFDAAAYGGYIDMLLDIVRNSNVSIGILSWDSFEHYLLGSPYFNTKLTKRDVSWRHNSLEQLSFETLKQLNDGYSKTFLNSKFKDPEFLYGILKEIGDL